MLVKSWFFVTLVLASLLLGTSFAHTLEMPVKLRYDAEQWLLLQQTLYRYFASAGGVFELGAIITATVLAFLVRRDGRSLLLVSAGAACLAIAFFGIWLFVTNRVNIEVSGWTSQSIPADWSQWRSQWEYSHLARFVLHLCGFCTLVGALLRPSPVPVAAPPSQEDARTRLGLTADSG
jgi:hypothetical protein